MQLTDLVGLLGDIHRASQARAARAVNRMLTLRNWATGAHLVQYEQDGQDRARWGERVVETAADRLCQAGIPGMSARNLWKYKKFATVYPGLGILPTLSAESDLLVPPHWAHKLVSAAAPGSLAPGAAFPSLRARLSRDSHPWRNAGYHARLLDTLSWSHFVELLRLDDPLERAFYEVEALATGWSVRELIRQRDSHLFARAGLSKDPSALADFARTGRIADTPAMIVRDPVVLEFLELTELVDCTESDLEQRLIDHLERFLLELGVAFTLAGRQKRITIDGQHFFIDLLLYHTLLKCYVVIEIKTTEFRPAYVGQLNLYLNYVRAHFSASDDNPPIGIVLCTAKSEPVVEYATAGLDQQLFVSRYLQNLPSRDQLASILRTHCASSAPRVGANDASGGTR